MIQILTICAALVCSAAVFAHGEEGNHDHHKNEQAAKSEQLFQDLGGEPGLRALVKALIEAYAKDKRINELFVNTDKDYFGERLYEDLCVRSGGPCEYQGLSMEDAHSGMDIKPAEFNYFVEDTQIVMDRLGIKVGTQNRLLKLLAREHGNVVRK
jgi:hemoglobin